MEKAHYEIFLEVQSELEWQVEDVFRCLQANGYFPHPYHGLDKTTHHSSIVRMETQEYKGGGEYGVGPTVEVPVEIMLADYAEREKWALAAAEEKKKERAAANVAYDAAQIAKKKEAELAQLAALRAKYPDAT